MIRNSSAIAVAPAVTAEHNGVLANSFSIHALLPSDFFAELCYGGLCGLNAYCFSQLQGSCDGQARFCNFVGI